MPRATSNTKNIRKYFRKLCIQKPITKRKQSNQLNKILTYMDIFSVTPTPQTFPVSTKKSRCASLTILTLFISYVAYDLYTFIVNNPPTLNILNLPLPQTEFDVPQMAIAFIYGNALNLTLTNTSYFTITLDQTYTILGQASTHQYLNLIPNCQPAWLGNLTNVYSNLSCVNSSQLKISGIPFQSYQSYQPRFQVVLCNNQTGGCCTQNQLYSMTSGGRIFLFIRKQPSIDFATGQPVIEQYQYIFNTYFLVPYLYNRVILNVQPNIYEVYGNLLTTFFSRNYTQMLFEYEQSQNSNVTIYNSSLMLSLTFELTQNLAYTQIHYTTIITHISLWGALLSVIVSVFGIIFLTYNRNMYYKANPAWEDFEKVQGQKLTHNNDQQSNNSSNRQKHDEFLNQEINSRNRQLQILGPHLKNIQLLQKGEN